MIARWLYTSFWLTFWAVALAACGRDGSATSLQAHLDAPIQLAPKQSAVFKAEQLEVQFVDIASDSRCPNDVTCVWAGEVVVRLRVRQEGRPTEIEIKEAQSL